jgi:hypothetical protein
VSAPVEVPEAFVTESHRILAPKKLTALLGCE